jgi:hypothetical protein
MQGERTDAADWEAVVLDRLRDRLERTATDEAVDVGWESAALERLRAHFDGAA